MKKAAIVRFIGNQEHYRLTSCDNEYKHCRECLDRRPDCHVKYQFITGRQYNAYFLEYWQGERTSLHVKGEDGKIDDFNPITDFEIIVDEDNVLCRHEAIVKCITHDYDEQLFDLNFGATYKAIGFDKNDLLLVMDESFDCYFYPRTAFEVVCDESRVIDPLYSLPVYDWKNTHVDSI